MGITKIQWTERTWNPVTGCTKISEGCRHCYAETMAKRLQGMGQKRYANGFKLTLHPEALNEPKKIKEPSMFFVCSMGDLFHKDVPFDFIDSVMDVIESTPQHTYQILTKRPERMSDYFRMRRDVPKNAWIGTTVESFETVHRIEVLRTVGKYDERKGEIIRFLSCEPLLSHLSGLDLSGISWVITGGESGSRARKMEKEWVLEIKRQCEVQNVPFFFKQWGTWGEDGIKRNKKANGCAIDGVVYQEWPVSWKGNRS